LGISHTALAKKPEMSLAGIGFSAERGESIARSGKYSLDAGVGKTIYANL